MITVRKSHERGHVNHGWLDTYHTFSFADYYDPNFMGHRALRVINEDRVAPGKGFGRHPHRDMEIITYVLEGALEHADSMGNGSIIHAGNFQKMSAGTGIEHSEFNPSGDTPVHLYQIWIQPGEKGLTPAYQELNAQAVAASSQLRLIGTPDAGNGHIHIHQDVKLYLGRMKDGALTYSPVKGRHVWLQVTRGTVEVNGVTLHAGDGAAVEKEDVLNFTSVDSGEFLLFDLA
ncbi:MAG: pirin family protein [Candidatus Hydrogenedentes bacterium]|nr:pirin family protein [Candidatus Hydrogenedentota bacterium]MBI3119941.1 pirin family protein [Candidatus Hydrogenedentota bacterium]